MRDRRPLQPQTSAEGETGNVYDGQLKFDVQKIDLRVLTRPRTKIMTNVGNPDEALRLSLLPNDGVGLARLEFIINSAIKIHPLALVHYDSAALSNPKRQRFQNERVREPNRRPSL